MPVSSRGYFVMAKESTPTTPEPRGATRNSGAQPAYWAYPVEEVDFMPEKQFIDFREIRGSRQAYTTLDGAFQPTAMIRGAVYPGAALGQILYGAFGDAKIIDRSNPTATPTQPLYSYDTDIALSGVQFEADSSNAASDSGTEILFSDGDALPSFTIERSDGRDGNATVVEQLAGCKIESLQFTANFGEKVDMTVNFQAAKKNVLLESADTYARQAYTSAGLNSGTGATLANKIIYPGQELSHTTEDITPLYFNRAAIKLDGGSYVFMKTLSWELTNTLTRQETLNATVNGNAFNITQTNDAYKIFEGGMECTVSGTAVFEDLNLYNRMMSGEEFELELWLGSDTILDRGATSTTISGVVTPYTLDDAYNGLYFYWPRVKVSRASIPFTAGEVIESDVEFKVIFKPSVSLTTFDGAAVTNAYSGSMFAKMVSRVGQGATTDRPWFY